MTSKSNRTASIEQIRADRIRLLNPYAHVDDDSLSGFSALMHPSPVRLATASEISSGKAILGNPYAHLDEDTDIGYSGLSQISYLETISKKSSYDTSELEQIARELQVELWRNTSQLDRDPIKILDPIKALKFIGYSVDQLESLGFDIINGVKTEVAGQISRDDQLVRISRRFPIDVRNFTAAHELGHALLHHGNGLHRDKPVNGVVLSRNATEFQADKFAAFFLMPSKLVVKYFRNRFLTEEFVLNEASRFALGEAAVKLSNVPTTRQLSTFLAGAEFYNGKHFVSLAQQFGVSVGAMAIRLEELNLLC